MTRVTLSRCCLGICLWATLVAGFTGPGVGLREAAASKPRCRLERVDFDPAVPDQLRVLANLVELEGLVQEQPPRSFRLAINGRPIGAAQKSVSFEKSGQDAYVVLLVEIAALYAPSIDKIKEALTGFLEALPPRMKVQLILFGTDIDIQSRFQPAASLTSQIDDINPDDEGDVVLSTAIDAGLRSLKNLPAPPKRGDADKAAPPPRKLIVALSDGLNTTMTRKFFTGLGDRLHKADVALFPVAFSPRDDRGPLLNLGELAKRSAGTFRWAKDDNSLKEQFQNLADELKGLQVLTFSDKLIKKFDDEALQRASYALACGEVVSNPFSFGGAPPGRPAGWSWWIKGPLWLLGALAGLWAVAQGTVFLLNRRQRRAGQGAIPAAPGTPGAVHPPPGSPQVGAAGTGAYPQAGTGAYPQAPAPSAGAAVVVQAARSQTPSGPATLICIGGALGGQRVAIASALTIGKSVDGPGCLKVADDPTVSGRHCELRRDAGGWILADLGSTNGSFVNDRRVTAPVRLQDGDLIRIGTGTQFKFRVD